MKIKFISLLILFVSLIVVQPIFAEDFLQDFLKTDLGKQLVQLGTDIADNPAEFVYDFHLDTEDIAPVPKEKTVTIQTNLLPTLLPFTIANISPKVRLVAESEDSWYPQIDLIGGYWSMVAASVASNMVQGVKASIYGYNVGGVMTKSLNEQARFFVGGKYSATDFIINVSSPMSIGFNDVLRDTFIFVGLEYASRPGKLIIVQTGYGFKYKKIVSKIILSYGLMEIGLAIYPEGVLVVHPVWNMHLRF